MIDDPRRQRIRAVIRDFFRDKPLGTTFERCELDAYYRRLREAAQVQDGDDSDPGDETPL